MWTVNEIRTRVEELEADGVRVDKEADTIEDGAATEDFEDLAEFKGFLNFIDNVMPTDDDLVDALLEYNQCGRDALGMTIEIIQNYAYFVYESDEEFGREYVDNCCDELPSWLKEHLDFDGVARDLLRNSSHTYTSAGLLIVFV